jgi:ribose-phosphate pyrophosphokinase
MKRRKIILGCPEMSALCEQVSKSVDFLPYHININWGTFADGFPDTMINEPGLIKGEDVFFIANFEKLENLFRYLSVLYALPAYGARTLTVFLPYFPTATMERVSVKGQIATAKTLMRMLNAIPACHGGGPARLITYDIHSLAVQHFHADGIIVELQSAIPLLLERIWQHGPYVFAFPDDGAKKRFQEFFSGPCIICTKDENRIVKIKEGAKLVPGAHVFIIDDMVRNGDTLINCNKALMEAGAADVCAYVTHGVFPENSWKKFQDGSFLDFLLTDSCITSQNLEKVEPFEVLSLSKLIAKEISEYSR